MRGKRQTASILACAACLAYALPALRGSAPPPNVEIVHINLRNFGWQPPPQPRGREMGNFSQHIAIDRQGRVLVAFTVPPNRPGLATREPTRKHPGGFLLRVLRFDRSGRPDFSLSLPAANWRQNDVYLDENDHILVRTNDRLQALAGGKWETLAPCGPNCYGVWQSPSRRTFVLESLPRDLVLRSNAGGLPRLDESCQTEGRIPGLAGDAQDEKITDTFAYWSEGMRWPEGRSSPVPPSLYRWPICDPQKWTAVPVQSGAYGGVYPLNDHLFVIGGLTAAGKYYEKVADGDVVNVVSVDGESRFLVRFPNDEEVESYTELFATSDTGDRFAVSVATWRRNNRVARRIIVFQTATGRRLAAIPITPHAWIALAMSPDGHRVASLAYGGDTIDDGILTVAHIP